ncbi:MAG: hypothetical protein AAGE96_26080 [Cyanobacteria bacterium P01_G01_bin.19]
MKTIKQSTVFGITLAGIAIAIPTFYSAAHARDYIFIGTVERVWEDGFRLNTGDRTFRVDSWDICGDNTTKHLSADREISVLGEFSGFEFDASSITDREGNTVCALSKSK